MRYALVSDVHANLQAWRAVYNHIQTEQIDEIISLGDIVGFGSEPARVLESMTANVSTFVQGNHDAAVCGQIHMNHFNKSARHILEWTKDRLDPGAIRFLQSIPLAVAGDGFVCVHGDLAEPEKFRYLHKPQDAFPTWQATDEQVIFIGHTHIPGIHMVGEMGMPHWLPPQELRLGADMRYVINVGSVGQPRDGKLEACYCIFDTDKKLVTFKRIPYDVEEFLKGMHLHNLPIHPCMQADHSLDHMSQAHNMAYLPDIEEDEPVQKTKKQRKKNKSNAMRSKQRSHSKGKIKRRRNHAHVRARSSMSSAAFFIIIIVALIIIGITVVLVALTISNQGT